MKTTNNNGLITEESSLYRDLEKKTIIQTLTEINEEDSKIAKAVKLSIPSIEIVVDNIVRKMKIGGRLFYIGAGTSGRLGVLDASEIPPTFGFQPNKVIGIIAGGETALRNPVENAEDSTEDGWKNLQDKDICSNDVVVGIAASGTTTYVIEALKKAKTQGIYTACITCNPNSPLARVCDQAIEVVVGPEYITGSTRLKAGTAQKMVLNMISTTTMIQLGRVKGNKMINMQLSNAKLKDRAIRILTEELGVTTERASELLNEHKSLKKIYDTYRVEKKP